MRRPMTTAAVLLTCASVLAVPAAAAPAKKPKPIKGSYTLNLLPDPTAQSGAVTGEACGGVVPAGKDQRAFTVPAAGTLQVLLESADPTSAGVTDWDLALLDADGAALAAGTTGSSNELVSAKFKKKTKVSFLACNVNGQPSGTVSYTFTYA